MPGPLDLLLVALFAVAWPLWSFFVSWPKHERAVAAGDSTARTRVYRTTIVEQWLLAGAALALFAWAARPLTSLGLRMPEGWRLAGFVLPALYAGLMTKQIPAFAAKPASRARVRERVSELRALLPHTAAEMRWFLALSITAGFCEELLFRGYLVWALQPWLGSLGAAGVSLLVFGLAHGYQGGKFGTKAFLAGLVMALLALSTRSLLPGILLHAFVDIGSGYVTYLAVTGPPVNGPVANETTVQPAS